MVVLCVYSGFGGHELETIEKTKKNHQNHRKNKEKQKKHHFQIISQNPEFVAFLGFYGGFGGQELETTAKTKTNQNNTIFKLSVKIQNSWLFVVFTVVLVVKSSKPPQKPRQTKKTLFSNYLSKSRIRGFSWFLQRFWWSRARNHRKNQEKPPKTTTNHQNHCKNQEKKNTIFKLSLKIQNSWFFLVFTVVLVVKSSKPPQKPRQTKKTLFSNYLSKSRIRGFSWFLRWFWWSRARNPPQKPRKTTNNHDKPPKPL